jgi:hypothetical protein
MNRIALTIGERVVHWDVDPQMMAMLAQMLVANLGPAEEGA